MLRARPPDLTLMALVWSFVLRVTIINFINRENPISVLYSTYFHPQRNTFPPFPRPLWSAPAHPERTGAALDSFKANAPRGTISADKNQYNKLLGVVRITVQESGSDWFTTVNYLAF